MPNGTASVAYTQARADAPRPDGFACFFGVVLGIALVYLFMEEKIDEVLNSEGK